jgi:hypothetical protein
MTEPKKPRLAKTAYADGIDVTRKEMIALLPSEIQVVWTRNTSRACLYTYRGAPCCFDLRDVEDLVLPAAALAAIKKGEVADLPAFINEHAGPISLLRLGQESPVSVYFDGKKRPVLAAGNRRLFAFLVLEEHGLLDLVPVAHGRSGKGKIEAITIEQPKDPEGWMRLATMNVAENGKKPATPVDIAWACRRFALASDDKEHGPGEYGLGYERAGQMVAPLVGHALSARAVQRYIQILSLPPDVVGQVHRGEISHAAAIRKASEEGHGRARGANPGVPHSKLRRISAEVLTEIAARRKPGDGRVFTAREFYNALRYVAGDTEAKAPSWLNELLERGEDAARAAKEAKGKKKAPPRAGKGKA